MYSSSGLKLKIFVKEGNSKVKSGDDKKKRYLGVTPLTGEKAKKFYEDILNEPSSSKEEKGKRVVECIPKQSKPKQNQAKSKIFRDSDLLQMAQNNDVKNLEIFLSQNQNYDINVVDDFGWTPLMCAACSGAEQAVKILLQNGANPHKCDKLGNTALKLAKRKNQKSIVTILENLFVNDELETEEEGEDLIQPYFCSVCKEEVTLNKKKHETSTLHLFNCKIKTPTFYGIPESNKGFQLLLKEGWDRDNGLGPSGTGRKFPIKVEVKKDRSGIGNEPMKRKSTFTIETKHTGRYENKKRKMYNRWRDKEFEKSFRSEFL